MKGAREEFTSVEIKSQHQSLFHLVCKSDLSAEACVYRKSRHNCVGESSFKQAVVVLYVMNGDKLGPSIETVKVEFVISLFSTWIVLDSLMELICLHLTSTRSQVLWGQKLTYRHIHLCNLLEICYEAANLF